MTSNPNIPTCPCLPLAKAAPKLPKERGFSNIFEAAERARTLPALIEKHLEQRIKAPRSITPVAKNWPLTSRQCCKKWVFTLQRQVVYETTKINRLAPAVIKGLEADQH